MAFIEQTLRTVVDSPDTGSGHRGCLLMNSASELGPRAPWILTRIAAGKCAFAGVFRTAVQRAQDDGDIPANRDAGALALFLVSNMSGLHTLLKAGTGHDEAHAIIDNILRALH